MSEEAEKTARLFHDTYERLAPAFGYETRKDTKDFDPESKNGRLMIAVCQTVAKDLRNQSLTEAAEAVRKVQANYPSEEVDALKTLIAHQILSLKEKE